MKNEVKKQHVATLCDEMTDRRDRKGNCVFVVLIKLISLIESQKLYFGCIKFLENANVKECSRAILEVWTKYDIKYDNVAAVVSDGAGYMTTSVQALTVTLPTTFCTCSVIHLWLSGLPELNVCVTNAKMPFLLNTRKRKHKYMTYLREKYPHGEKKAKVFPSPVLTRWNSWHKSAQYISEYLEDLVDFFRGHDEGRAAVDYFKSIGKSTVAINASNVVSVFCEAIEVLEGSTYPYIHRLETKLADIKSAFQITSSGTFGDKTMDYLNQMPNLKTLAVKEQLKNLGAECSAKLSNLIMESPVKSVIVSMGQVFDPRNVVNNEVNNDLIKVVQKIPFMTEFSARVHGRLFSLSKSSYKIPEFVTRR